MRSLLPSPPSELRCHDLRMRENHVLIIQLQNALGTLSFLADLCYWCAERHGLWSSARFPRRRASLALRPGRPQGGAPSAHRGYTRTRADVRDSGQKRRGRGGDGGIPPHQETELQGLLAMPQTIFVLSLHLSLVPTSAALPPLCRIYKTF